MGTNVTVTAEESPAVWEQLLRLAEEGDIRAIKLYYDMLEKKQRPSASASVACEPEPMAAIRRAVFGDAAVDEAAAIARTRGAVVGSCLGDGEGEEDG